MASTLRKGRRRQRSVKSQLVYSAISVVLAVFCIAYIIVSEEPSGTLVFPAVFFCIAALVFFVRAIRQ